MTQKMLLPSDAWLSKNGLSSMVATIDRYPKLFSHIPQESHRRDVQEWLDIATRLSLENGGTLPYKEWLCKNGYAGLVTAIRLYPRQFKKFSFDSRRTGVTRWVAVAERLVKEHQGSLPNVVWLKANGFAGLLGAIYKHPSRFAHIKRDVRFRPVEEWVKLAEAIAQKNGGKLPRGPWLKANGHASLYASMSRYRSHFSHIPLMGRESPWSARRAA